MKVTNIKKIVIWALIIVNASFLAFFLWRTYNDHSARNEVLANLSTLFRRNGIIIDTADIHEGGELTELKISRDTSGEQGLADILLGHTERIDQGGGIYSYTGTKGWAEFKNGGAFEMTFDDHVYAGATGAKNTAKSILQTMGIETVAVEVSGEKGNETVDALCSWERHPIFNCRISFVFSDGNLVKISGRNTANIEVTANKTDMSSCAAALMYFLNEVTSRRYSCTQITGVDPGYYVKATGDGIRAVWRIKAGDGAVYYVDAVTGSIETDFGDDLR